MHLRKIAYNRYVKCISTATVIFACGLQPLFAQTADTAVNSVEIRARELWRGAMSKNEPSTEGCFHAAYPNLVWDSVRCTVGVPLAHPTPRTLAAGSPAVVGNGHDWALGATGLITAVLGEFLNVKNVKSEKGVGVASFGGGGILGPNEYTLQLNSNDNATTSACAGHSGCTVWQQYLYATDVLGKGKAGVFIQYWLLNWGTAACPHGYIDAGTSCFKNSAAVAAPDTKITDLGKLQLEGTAVAGGNDMVFFSNGTNVYSVKTNDSVLNLGLVWTQAEFNVVGNAGGSRANFNTGASFDVVLGVEDGSAAAPHCLLNKGTTGETNNLNLGTCITARGSSTGSPGMAFFEGR